MNSSARLRSPDAPASFGEVSPERFARRRKPLVVFDLDGTLVDSLQDLSDAVDALLVELGAAPLGAARIACMVGDGAEQLVRRALDARQLAEPLEVAQLRFLALYDERLLTHTVEYAGMREALSDASPRVQMAVLTNKPLLPARALLTRLRLDHFFALVVGGDGPHPRKPDPRGLLAAAEELGATTVLLVGDSPVDQQTARAAGCAFAYARYGFGAVRFERAPATSYVLDHPSDLGSVLDRFLTSVVER